jgi:RNA polymerase sigma-70 factor (ECF subfamily)
MSNRAPFEASTIKAFKEGSPGAFTVVYRYYYPPVCDLGKLALKDLTLVDEYVEKFFLCIWMYRDAIGKVHYFDTYLWLTAKYLLHIYRRQTVDTENDIGRFICEEHIREEFYRELNKLPPLQKEIFILSHEKDLSVQKIAELLNIEKAAVKDQLCEAKKSLRVSFALQQDDLEAWDLE